MEKTCFLHGRPAAKLPNKPPFSLPSAAVTPVLFFLFSVIIPSELNTKRRSKLPVTVMENWGFSL